VTAPTPEGNSDRQAGWVAAFYPHWVAATGVAMVLLLAYGWVLLPGQPLSIRAIYLAGPAYMAHQIEEHRGDRFLAYVNRRQFGGRPALTPLISLLVNIPGVWGTNLIALYAALRWHPGWGLTAVWLMSVTSASADFSLRLRLITGKDGFWLLSHVCSFLPYSSSMQMIAPFEDSGFLREARSMYSNNRRFAR